jgi:5-formaminoimidazole-4-carboxamide-1-beta-D-ribofuranosyl 5'-monophosphate synthetase
MDMGERIAHELVTAAKSGRLHEVVT